MNNRKLSAVFLSLILPFVLLIPILASASVPTDSDKSPRTSPLAYLPLVVRNLQPVTFTHGIASGDVTSSTADLWTRTNREAILNLQLSKDPTFTNADTYPNLLARAAVDFTLKFEVDSLEPEERYYYRWTSGGVASPTGVFVTAPEPAAPADVSFVFTGDSDGTLSGGVPFWNNFEALDAARLENHDFFIFLGDTIYSDSSARPSGPAITLDEYRETYKVNLDYPALTDLLAASSTYAIWDDHEVYNDFAGATVDPARYQNGRQAFLEYMPIHEALFPNDPACAGDPLYRTFHWGSAADMVILDQRSCRSSIVDSACRVFGVLDPAPTAPPDVRTGFGLPAAPPPGCLAEITDPSRTFLGGVQMQLLKDFLLNSTAKWKFVISELPIQQLYVYPYDRWEGYAAEREEILNFIRDNNIENVIFLSADMHTNFINQVSIDKTSDPAMIAHEFVTGPVAARTLEEAIMANPLVDLDDVQAALTQLGLICRHLNAYSYGAVEIDASAGTATISLKDDTGAVLEDQVNPGVFCSLTLGP